MKHKRDVASADHTVKVPLPRLIKDSGFPWITHNLDTASISRPGDTRRAG